VYDREKGERVRGVVHEVGGAVVSLVAVLVLGCAISVVVGNALRGAGRPFLDDVLRDGCLNEAVARLLTVLFYLLALVTVALISILDLPGWSTVYAIALKLGIVLLVIGAAHGLTLIVLLRIKKRRRRQVLEEDFARRTSRPAPTE
jgi:hypothetical protein